MTTLNPFFGIVIDDIFTQIKCNSEVIYHLWTNDAILTTKNIVYSNDTIRDITVKFDKGQNEILDKLDVNQSGTFVFSENFIIHKIECQVNFKQINGNEITLTLMPNKSAIDTISLDTDKIPVSSSNTIDTTNNPVSGISSQLKISSEEKNAIKIKSDGIYVEESSSEGFNYEGAANKPSINSVELIRNKTSNDLGLANIKLNNVNFGSDNKGKILGINETGNIDLTKQIIYKGGTSNTNTVDSEVQILGDDNDTIVVNSDINISQKQGNQLKIIEPQEGQADTDVGLYVEKPDLDNKANIALDNINVGEGKEDKLLSFDANGTPKFIDQVQPTPSGIVFEKEIELTNAYNGTSTTEIGTSLYRVDGVKWNEDQDLVNYFDGNYKFILQYVGNYNRVSGNIKLSGITSSISANGVVESNTQIRDIPIYNLCFLISYDKDYLISLENNVNINLNNIYIDFTNWFHTVYGISTLILVSSTNGSQTNSTPKTYKFVLKVVRL